MTSCFDPGMTSSHDDSSRPESFTARLAADAASFSLDSDRSAFEWGRHALLDWLGVTLAGSREESAKIAMDYAAAVGGASDEQAGQATLVGTTKRVAAPEAILANGIAAHALDFDDNNSAMCGHPSAPMVSAVVALAEREGASPSAMIEALVAGHHVAGLVGSAVGMSPYARGFHTTGVYGTFGAAAACGRLLGLDSDRMRHALGLAATQAAGLKVSFGTMGKHLNAAKAGVNGLLAADLAARGFTGGLDAIEGEQGFAASHSAEFDPERAVREYGDGGAIRSSTFKQHACCGGTHSAIETVRAIHARRPFEPDEVEAVELTVNEFVPKMCGVAEPRSGLEGKFSIRYATALALAGRSTGPDAFTDEAVSDPAVGALRRRVTVTVSPTSVPADPTGVLIRLSSGEVLQDAVAAYRRDGDAQLDSQWTALVRKFLGLATPIVGAARAAEMVDAIADLERRAGITEIIAVTG